MAPTDQQISTIYASLPLDPSTFSTRLLTILPGAPNDELRCRLRSTRINANTSYEALSYTWGDGHLCQEITVNDQQFTVTSNLEQALRALRKKDRRRTIWVDAVCIDQSNLLEKGVYVRGMGYIYRLAKQVVIWLGPEGEATSATLRCIQHNELRHKPPPLPHYEPEFVWDEEVRDLLLKWKQYRILEATVSSGLQDLTSRQWWSRVWVVQELCMAAADPLLICGHSTISWTLFVRFVQSTTIKSAAYKLHIIDMDDLRKRARNPPRLRNPEYANDPTTSLLEDDLHWLRYTATFEASDPRDKIFALMALMRGPLRTQIHIDYTASMDHLTLNLMVDQINVHRSLSLLALCHYDGCTNRPSWLPDFGTSGLPPLPSTIRARSEQRTNFSRTRSGTTQSVSRARACFTWPRTGMATNSCSLDLVKSGSITAYGALLGHVQRMIMPHEEQLKWQGLSKEVEGSTEPWTWGQKHSLRHRNARFRTSMKISELERCNSLLVSAGLVTTPLSPLDVSASNIDNHFDLVDGLVQKLDAGRGTLILQLRSECRSLLREYLRWLGEAMSWAELHCHWYPLFSMLSSSDVDLANNTDALLCWEISDIQVQAGWSKRASILHAMEGRCQFTTNTGLIGLGPPEMQTGDEVVVFDASPFAFALRPSEVQNQLVGQVLICPPLTPDEYPTERMLDDRPTQFPTGWKEPSRHQFTLV